MAGAGYKLFNTGDVLTAAQVNTYLNEQTVMVFADSAARTSALSGVLAEGMMSYLQDTNAVEVYDGSSWVSVGSTGDITEVQAGTGISVASGTGPIPVVTSTMATAIDAEGDLIIGDAADAFQRLAIGSNTHVLTVDTSVDGKIKWAAPAAGAFVGCAVGRTTNLTVSNNVNTVIPYTTELYDTDSFHDNSTNPSRITIPAGKDGKYLITVISIFENNGTGERQQMLNKNGLQFNWLFIESVSSAASYSVLTGAIVLDLVATDYIEINVKQNSGGNRTLFGDSAMLQVSKIG